MGTVMLLMALQIEAWAQQGQTGQELQEKGGTDHKGPRWPGESSSERLRQVGGAGALRLGDLWAHKGLGGNGFNMASHFLSVKWG